MVWGLHVTLAQVLQVLEGDLPQPEDKSTPGSQGLWGVVLIYV
jgi:hypothetical protein